VTVVTAVTVHDDSGMMTVVTVAVVIVTVVTVTVIIVIVVTTVVTVVIFSVLHLENALKQELLFRFFVPAQHW
jgi:hypothetical protein